MPNAPGPHHLRRRRRAGGEECGSRRRRAAGPCQSRGHSGAVPTVILEAADSVASLSADLAIVGSGPAGIVTALEMADAGFDVVLIESGYAKYSSEIQALGDAANLNQAVHAPM